MQKILKRTFLLCYTLCFVTQLAFCMEPETLELHNNDIQKQTLLREIVVRLSQFIGYHELEALTWINKSIRSRLLNKEEILKRKKQAALWLGSYDEKDQNVAFNQLGAVGYIGFVCKKCLAEEATCICAIDASYSCYPGMLVRLQKESDGIKKYRSYVASEHINRLVDWYNEGSKYKHIASIISDIHIPQFTIPPDLNYECKRFATSPYFNKNGELCMITSNELNKGHYLRVDELCLSNRNVYTQRKVHFELGNSTYSFSFLIDFPLLQDAYIKQITHGQCEVKRDRLSSVFQSTNFFKKCLPEAEMHTTFAHMFEAIASASEKHSSNFDLSWRKRIVQHHKTDTDHTELLKATLCAKLCGNEDIAYNYIQAYNYVMAEPVENTSLLLTPFGCVCRENDNFYYAIPYKGYKKALNSLSTLQSIDILLEKITYNKTRLIKLNENYFIEIRKKGFDYTLYPWQHQYQHTFHCDWKRGQQHRITNCVDTIVNAFLPQSFFSAQYPDVLTVKTVRIDVEQARSDGTMAIETYTLNADEPFDAHFSELPQDVIPLLQESKTQTNLTDWVHKLSLDDCAAFLKVSHRVKNTAAEKIAKDALLKSFDERIDYKHTDDCDCSADNDNCSSFNCPKWRNHIIEESNAYIRKHLEKIINNALPTLSFEKRDYTDDEQKKSGLLPSPDTVTQLTTHLQRAAQWHSPSATLRRTYPDYAKLYGPQWWIWGKKDALGNSD